MLVVEHSALPELERFFTPELPGPSVYAHIVNSGYGECLVDRWPNPCAAWATLGGNYSMRGSPEVLDPQGDEHLAALAGFVDAPPDWRPLLEAVDPDLSVWDLVVATLPASADVLATAGAVRLTADHADQIASLPAEIAWVSVSWGGPHGLATAEVGHGALVDGQLAAVAVPFTVGHRYEDIGVVTVVEHRGKGLSTACAAAVVADTRERGRIPTWTTSPDNTASLAVANRLGFVTDRTDVLYVVRTSIPT